MEHNIGKGKIEISSDRRPDDERNPLRARTILPREMVFKNPDIRNGTLKVVVVDGSVHLMERSLIVAACVHTKYRTEPRKYIQVVVQPGPKCRVVPPSLFASF